MLIAKSAQKWPYPQTVIKHVASLNASAPPILYTFSLSNGGSSCMVMVGDPNYFKSLLPPISPSFVLAIAQQKIQDSSEHYAGGVDLILLCG